MVLLPKRSGKGRCFQQWFYYLYVGMDNRKVKHSDNQRLKKQNVKNYKIDSDKRKNPNQSGSDFVVQVRGLEPP